MVPKGAREVAIRAAKEAGALLRGRLSQDRNVEFKGVIDLVTDADRAAEELISRRIQAKFPDHRFIGEEGTRGASDAPYGWIVDPLDGTTNYAHAYPHFATSIALEREGHVVLGVIYDPMRDELFVAERGRGAELNGAPIHVSEEGELIRSLLATGFPYNLENRMEAVAIWNALLHRCQGVRRDGSAALNLAWTAAGRLDGFYEKTLKPWDMGAGSLLIEEAGGIVTNYAGGPFDVYGIEIIGANPALHGPLMEAVNAAIAELAGTA